MEVIARRKNSLLTLWGLITVLGGLMIIVSLVKPFYIQSQKTGMFLIGLMLFGIGCVVLINILRTPKNIICFDGQNLILPQGKYPLKSLSNVNYRRARIRGVNYRWGRITLTINGQKFEYTGVEDVEKVHDRIMELRLALKS